MEVCRRMALLVGSVAAALAAGCSDLGSADAPASTSEASLVEYVAPAVNFDESFVAVAGTAAEGDEIVLRNSGDRDLVVVAGDGTFEWGPVPAHGELVVSAPVAGTYELLVAGDPALTATLIVN